jgi:hypothetical protein
MTDTHKIVAAKKDVANRLAHKLGLRLQTPGKDIMTRFAKRARELQSKGQTVDQATIVAANEIFSGDDFRPTHYNYRAESIETILADIEEL